MKKISYLLLLALFICQAYTAEASLDFSNFITIGFEGKAEMEFNQPEDLIQAPDGNYLLADTGNNRIQVFDPSGKFIRIIPPPKAKNEALTAQPTDNRPANLIKLENNGLRKPVGLAFDSEGKLYVTLMNNDMIVVIDYPTGQIKGTIGSSGKKEGQFWMPMDIDIDDQDRIAVAEFRNKRVQILDLDGNQINEILYQEQTEKGGFRQLEPRGVFWTADGDLIVTYPNYHQVVCWNIKDGQVRWRYGGKASGNKKGMLNNPSFVAQGVDSHLMISDTKNHRIVEITRDGKFYESHSQKGSSKGRLNFPRGLFLTKDETMVVADSGNSRIQFFTAGATTLLLKEAKALANKDDWNAVMMNVEKVLQLQPNNEQALDLKVNALYYFGDNAFKNQDYDKAEDYYRMVLRYRPDDGNIPQKLDAIFWENNRPILISAVAIILGLIGLVIILWLLKLVFRRIKAKVTE
jgi:sugar lactone lactonase YvrE